VHDTTLAMIRERFVINPQRVILWERLNEFMKPFFAAKFETIYETYSVHLHFWGDGFPKTNDFRLFFQYLRPQDVAPLGLSPGARKGIVRIKL